MSQNSDTAFCSQPYWEQVEDLHDLDLSLLDQVNEHVEELPDAPSPHSSFSYDIEPELEAAMISFAESEETTASTEYATQPTSSESSSSTLTTSKSTSLTSAVPSRTTTLNLSQSNATLLGKRSVSDVSLTENPRASKTSRQGDNLHTPVVVAYSKAVQRWIDLRDLPWGVQWEIARLTSIANNGLDYEKIRITDLDELKKLGNNAKAAPMVEKILLRKKIEEANINDDLFANERKAKFPYEELDLEEKLSNDAYAGLGFNANSDWFGGKVVFRAKLENASEKDPDQFKITLGKAELGASSRFSRRFGSKSFVRVKIHKSLQNSKYSEALIDFFRRPFIIAGKVFRAFFEKEKTVFLYMTNEVPEWELVLGSTQKVPGRLSFEDFLQWHNPIEPNQQQSVAKYASRFALGLSTSAPGLEIKPENIIFIEDTVSLTGSDMTDGAGLINKAALAQLKSKFGWDLWPTAIQCRIAGSKGMLLQHPDDDSEEPKVYVRPSMNKIKYPALGSEPAHCIIDVLRTCHPRFSCDLSSETIINLAENGVPKRVFTNLLDKTLDALIASLTAWETLDDMKSLWKTLARLGGVFSARSARHKSGMARVHGYSERDSREEDEDVLDDDSEGERSTAWWDDEVSGQPSSLEETVMRFLDGGFTPKECPVMRDKLKHILTKEIDNSCSRLRLEVPMSLTAFIVPDPESVLEEGEIYFKSSHRGIITEDGRELDVLTGPVIVTRHPCKLPTDAQKWVGVDRPELRHYTDVIIISIKGERRGADWLGGGDYDGDKSLVIYQPEIVNPFRNADRKLGDPRDDIKAGYFLAHTETVTELTARAPVNPINPLARIHALQEYLIGGIKTASLVGRASNMHDCLLYERGLSNPETIRMAHIFCHTLDGTKTGLRAKPDLWKADTKRYDKGSMHWKEKKSNTAVSTSNVISERPKGLRSFIMDSLLAHARVKGGTMRGDVTNLCDDTTSRKKFPLIKDKNLAAPWEEAERKTAGSEIMRQDLERIRRHVHSMRVMWDANRQKEKDTKFTDLSIETRQDILRKISREFASGPDEAGMHMLHDQILQLKASYAYIYDYEVTEKKCSRFPWDVTMRQLTEIKAKSLGSSRTVFADFYENFTLKQNRH